MLKYFFLTILFTPIILLSQESADPFVEIDEKILELSGKHASLLAADYYQETISLYNLVLEDYHSGYTLDELQSDLMEVKSQLADIDTLVTKAEPYFTDLILLREQGIEMKADSVASAFWSEGDDYFYDAIDDFADNDDMDAEENKIIADSLYNLSINLTTEVNETAYKWQPEVDALSHYANLLSPNDFNEAQVNKLLYFEAVTDGESLEDIESLRNLAIEKYEQAIANCEKVRMACGSLIEARENALNKRTFIHSPEYWYAAESRFTTACEEFNDEDNDYWQTAIEAEEFYIESIMETLKNHYLENVNLAIEEAYQNRANSYAPKTLRLSESFREQVIMKVEIIGDYSSEIDSLANQAVYEAKHADYISSLLQKMEDDGKTNEDIVLSSEKQLGTIANFIMVPARFDQDYGITTEAILDVIRNSNIATRPEEPVISEDIVYNNTLEDEPVYNESEIVNFETYSQESYISSLFLPNEAEVINEDTKMTIRLTGLVFPAASSRLEASEHPLLDKVVTALTNFPDSPVSVEVHTDSRGSRNFNESLSQQRAEVITDYLSKRVDNDITSTGLGESDPIADDSTEEGRQKNRRVEIVITK